MSVVATARISQGEEVLVSYNYNLADCPAWYSAAWFTHLRDDLQWSEVRLTQYQCYLVLLSIKYYLVRCVPGPRGGLE